MGVHSNSPSIMSVPMPPVLKKEVQADRAGVLISWINPAAGNIDTYTISFKAESWWTAQTVEVPGQMTEYMIQGSDLPPNSKLAISMYSTNSSGSSGWSNE